MASTHSVRELPRNLEAEQVCIGAALLQPELTMLTLAEALRPDHFSDPRHRIIFKNMLTLFNRGLPGDIILVANRLEEMGEMDKAGGRMYLNALLDQTTTTASVEYYADVVKKKAQLRFLVEVGGRISELGFDEEEETEILYDRAMNWIMDEATESASGEIKHISEFGDEFLGWLGRMKGEGKVEGGLSTGYSSLDDRLWDLRGTVTVVAGASSMGKTSLMLNMTWKMALRQQKVGYLTLEMSPNQMLKRLTQIAGRITNKQLRAKSDSDVRKLMLDVLAKPIHICKFSENSLWSIMKQMRELRMKHGIETIFIDHLQEMMIPGYSAKDRVRELGVIMGVLRQFAMKYDLGVLIGSQLNRDGVDGKYDGGRPKLKHLRESGRIEESADIVLGVWRESYFDHSIKKALELMELWILKDRNDGQTGMVPMDHYRYQARLEACVKDEPEEEDEDG